MADNEDVKVVELRFDNKRFEKNVRKSRKTIKELQKDLDRLEGKDLEINTAQSEKNIKKFGSAIDEVKLKFSSLQVIGVAAISHITNEVIDSAESIISSMSAINSIAQGYESYTSQLTSMRTLLNIYGTEKFGFMNTEQIEEQLERLKWYTDETSYSFEAMTQTMSSFGVAGIQAEDAISALEGFGNWAAGAGLSISQANNLIDNLSRAIAAGRLTEQQFQGFRLSGMVSDDFLESLKEAAIDLGTLRETANGTYKTIRDKEKKITGGKKVTNKDLNLSAGWVTSEVFTEALKKYSEYTDQVYDLMASQGIEQTSEAMKILDQQIIESGGSLDTLSRKTWRSSQEAKTLSDAIGAVKVALSSSWSDIFKKVLGDVEESSVFWTEVSDKLYNIFVSGQEARYEAVEGWYNLGGREKLIESIYNLLDGIKQRLDIFKEGFSDIIPKVTTDNLIKFTDKFNELSKRFILNEKQSKKLKKAYKNIVSVFVSLKNIVVAFFNTIKKIFSGSDEDKVVTFTDILISIISGIGKIFGAIGSLLSSQWIIDLFIFLGEKLANGIIYIGNKIKDAIEWIKNTKLYQELKDFISKIKDIIYNKKDTIEDTDDNTIDQISDDLEKSGEKLKDDVHILTGIASFLEGLFEFIKGLGITFFGLFDKAGAKLKEWGQKFINGEFSITDFLKAIALAVTAWKVGDLAIQLKDTIETFSSISEAFWSWYNENMAEAFKKIAVSLLMFAGSLLILSGIDWKDLIAPTISLLAAISLMGIFIRVALGGLTKDSKITTTALSAIGGKNGIFSKLSILGQEVGAIAITNRSKAREIEAMSSLMLSIGASIFLIAISLKKLSNIGNEVWNGLLYLGLILTALTISMKIVQHNKEGAVKGAAVVFMYGVVIKKLAKLVEPLGKLKVTELLKGIASIIAIMAVLTLSLVTFAAIGTIPKFSFVPVKEVLIAMYLMMGPILILTSTFKNLAKLKNKEIKNGLKSLAVIVGAIAIIMGLFLIIAAIPASIPVLFAMTLIVAAMAGAVYLFAISMKKLSGMQLNISGIVEQMGKLFELMGIISLSVIAITALSPAMVTAFTTILGLDVLIATTAGSIGLLAVALETFADALERYKTVKAPDFKKITSDTLKDTNSEYDGKGTLLNPFKIHLKFIVDDSEIKAALDRSYVLSLVANTAQAVYSSKPIQSYDATAINEMIASMLEAQSSGSPSSPTIENNFYITNDDPDEVANRVSEIFMEEYIKGGGPGWIGGR